MHQKLLTTSLTLLIATQPVDNNKLKPSPSNPGMPSWDTSPGKENRFFFAAWLHLCLFRTYSTHNPGKSGKSVSIRGNKKAMEMTI